MTHTVIGDRLSASSTGVTGSARRRVGFAALLATSLLPARAAHAACDAARAVALFIEDHRDSTLQRSVERQVAAELRASDIGVCDAGASGVLATVHIRAPGPERPRAAISVSRADADPLERELDVASFPPEARALAIAITADELVRAVLAVPAPSASEVPATVPLPAASGEPAPELDTAAADEVDGADPRAAQARFELGVASFASSIFGQREALGLDLTARYWLTPRVALATSVGAARRLARPYGRGAVQPAHDVHVAVAAGYELWRDRGGLDLVALAGVELARVGFDEASGGGTAFVSPEPADYAALAVNTASALYALDAGAWLVARGGLEGRYRLRSSFGFSVALNALVPLFGAESDWGETTSLDRVGAEIGAGVWLALGSSE